jgi:hypothetical protein
MVNLHIGKHGVVLLVLLFLLLGIEDVLIWVRDGDLPALEFFVGLVIVLVVVAWAVRQANLFPPIRRSD